MLRQVEKTCQTLGLAHPHDRHGTLLKDRISSAELDAALEAYRQACTHACKDVRDRLRGLARTLMVATSHLPRLALNVLDGIITLSLNRPETLLTHANISPAAPVLSTQRNLAAHLHRLLLATLSQKYAGMQSLLLQLLCSQMTLTRVCPALQSMLPQLVCACTVSIIGAALDAHVRSAKDRGWGHPVHLPTAGSDDESRAPLQVQRASYD